MHAHVDGEQRAAGILRCVRPPRAFVVGLRTVPAATSAGRSPSTTYEAQGWQRAPRGARATDGQMQMRARWDPHSNTTQQHHIVPGALAVIHLIFRLCVHFILLSIPSFIYSFRTPKCNCLINRRALLNRYARCGGYAI